MKKSAAGEGAIGQCYTTLGEAAPGATDHLYDGSVAEGILSDQAKVELGKWKTSMEPKYVADRAKNELAVKSFEVRRAAVAAAEYAAALCTPSMAEVTTTFDTENRPQARMNLRELLDTQVDNPLAWDIYVNQATIGITPVPLESRGQSAAA